MIQIRINVKSGIKMPTIMRNNGHVYVRWDFVRNIIPATEDIPERTEWTYDEAFMTDDEFTNIQLGYYDEEWNDAFRSIEREYLYNNADKMISKYSTDVPDETMRQRWIEYKHLVRATQQDANYPQNVTYPEEPTEE